MQKYILEHSFTSFFIQYPVNFGITYIVQPNKNKNIFKKIRSYSATAGQIKINIRYKLSVILKIFFFQVKK